MSRHNGFHRTVAELTSSAATSDVPIAAGTPIAANRAVLATARQNRGVRRRSR